MTFEELQSLVETCTGPRASSFYKHLYGRTDDDAPLRIASWVDWRALPTFTKDDLLRTSMRARTFEPHENIDSILVSSGTSGKPPVFSPFGLNDGYGFRKEYHDFRGAALASIPPVTKKEWELSHINPEARVVALDPKRADASITIAEAANVDSLLVASFHIPLVGEKLAARGLAQRIRYIEIAGEPCTVSLFRYIRRTFPNAVIMSDYGSTDVETSPIGTLCHPIDGTEPLEVFHGNTNTYLELVDESTGSPIDPTEGAEGSLLITSYAGPNATFPLIRYRIGDSVRVAQTRCAKHGTWSFHILGRTEMDFIKVPGGLLRADEVERVLRTFGKGVTDRFELHYIEKPSENGLKILVRLCVETTGTVDFEELARHVSSHMRIAPTFSYADGVVRGIFLPIECVALSAPATSGKRKRMLNDSR